MNPDGDIRRYTEEDTMSGENVGDPITEAEYADHLTKMQLKEEAARRKLLNSLQKANVNVNTKFKQEAFKRMTMK